jgi:hypothetical protein
MKPRTILSIVIMLAVCLPLAVSCSGSKQITTPAAEENTPLVPDSDIANHGIFGIYDVQIDTSNHTISLEQVGRESSMWHCPLTSFFPNVLILTGYGFDPAHNNDFYADFKLRHPFPGSGIDAFDPRVIALLPANDGVSIFYPTFNVLANNSVLLNPDNYTPLFDNLASYDGNNNPYLAYFKSQPNRKWSSAGPIEDTRRWYLNLNGFGGPAQFKLVVDVSTAYPAQSVPVTDNTQEPVEMTPHVISNTMTQSGGQAAIEITFLDWQGSNNIKCKVECPDLFDLSVQFNFNRTGPNPNEYIFSGTITNAFDAAPGDYPMLIAVWDIPTGLHVYKETIIHVGFDPSAWTPDPTRMNIDLTTLGSTIPPKPGSDLGVIDNDDPIIGGVVMYEPDDMVVRISLDLTEADLSGNSYMSSDEDPNNPHPNPEVFPAGRIDAQSNGIVVQSWIDGHLGLGPDLAGQYQRCDALIGIAQPDAYGWLDMLIGAFPDMSNDNPITPDYDESAERPRLTDVYDECNSFLHPTYYTVGGVWSGTVVWDKATGNTFNPIGAMGGIKSPYWADPFIVMDWGLWIFTGPPSNEIVAADASQDPYYPYQYWGYSGVMTTNSLIGQYDKMGVIQQAILPSNRDAKLLDIELIPPLDPPIDVNGFYQLNDWLVVLMDNQTIEIIDPTFGPNGSVDMIDLSALAGDVKYIDVRNSTAEIYISHTDGVTPYCTVLQLGD